MTSFGTITFLRTAHTVRTKNLANGESYARTSRVDQVRSYDIESLEELLAILQRQSRYTDVHAIRGTLIDGAARPYRRKKTHFSDAPQRWVMIDVDKGALDVAGALARLPAPFAAASCVWQASASCPAEGGKWHLWFLLDAPLTAAQLRAWIGRAPNLDPVSLRAVQPLYTADPIGADERYWQGPRYGIHHGRVDMVDTGTASDITCIVKEAAVIAPRTSGTDWRGDVPRYDWRADFNVAAAGYNEANRVGALVGVYLARKTWNDVEHGHETWEAPGRRAAAAIGQYVATLPDAKHGVEGYTDRAFSGIEYGVAEERKRLAARVEERPHSLGAARDAAWRRLERAASTGRVEAVRALALTGPVPAEELSTRLGCSPAEAAELAAASADVEAIPAHDWLVGLERDKQGYLLPTELNVLRVAEQTFGGQFRRNVMSQAIENEQGEEQELDVVTARLFGACVANGMPKVSNNACRTIVRLVFQQAPEHNPLLDIAPVENNELLERWLIDWFGCEDTAYVRAVGARTLTALFARAYKPGYKHDTVLVLCGPQGAYKSSTLETLGRAIYPRGYASAGSRPLYERDTKEAIRSAYICEIAELAAMTARWASADALKDYITSTEDTYRAAYAAESKTHKRRNVLIGTTNETEFLSDIENRRFWPVKLPAATERKRVFTAKHARRLLAAAHAAWLADSPTYFRPEEEELRTAQRCATREVTESDELADALAPMLADRTEILARELTALCAAIPRNDGRQGWTGKRISRAMRELGWTPYQPTTGDRARAWKR